MSDWTTAGLPERPLLSGFSEKPQNNLLRTQMETGYPKQRLRYTAASTYYTVKYLLRSSENQITEWRTFFTTTISYGASSFTMPDPGDQAGGDVIVRIVGNDPLYTLVPDNSTTDYILSISLEKLP